MGLPLIFAAMLLAAMLAVLLPLARGVKPAGAAGASSVDLHRLRLAEIARDLDRGLLDQAGAEAARNEAARMLLRAAERDEAAVPAAGQGGETDRTALWRRRAVALVALIGLPAFALSLYGYLGSPGLPARPFVAAAPADPEKLDFAALIGKVEAHLAEHPDDGEGFELIAPIYLRLGRYEDALRARSEAMRLLGETPDRLADLAEARLAVSGGVMTREATEAIDKGLALEPKHAKARFLKAVALEQDGRREEAVAVLEGMLADAPPDAPWRGAVRSRLARLGAPSGGEAAAIAGLPPAAQGDAIRSMVEGLAARLKQQGGSAEEWARLVRSYAVLGETEKSRAALAEARAALPDEASRAILLETARASGLEASP
ncbi:MAG: c-type cytochrome biogenesis protein CcmI [Hyphomicrobiales bacterium]